MGALLQLVEVAVLLIAACTIMALCRMCLMLCSRVEAIEPAPNDGQRPPNAAHRNRNSIPAALLGQPTRSERTALLLTEIRLRYEHRCAGTADKSAICVICISEFEPGEPIVALPCGHIYHRVSCIEPWFRKSLEARCPLCNADILEAPPPLPATNQGNHQREATTIDIPGQVPGATDPRPESNGVPNIATV